MRWEDSGRWVEGLLRPENLRRRTQEPAGGREAGASIAAADEVSGGEGVGDGSAARAAWRSRDARTAAAADAGLVVPMGAMQIS